MEDYFSWLRNLLELHGDRRKNWILHVEHEGFGPQRIDNKGGSLQRFINLGTEFSGKQLSHFVVHSKIDSLEFKLSFGQDLWVWHLILLLEICTRSISASESGAWMWFLNFRFSITNWAFPLFRKPLNFIWYWKCFRFAFNHFQKLEYSTII